jgi:Dolichyl-phosphate-mannose-protein mannosyltransferase
VDALKSFDASDVGVAARTARGRGVAPRVAVTVVVFAFVSLSLAVALLTPPWEAADEPDHVKNVGTLASGSWYRMEPGSGLAAHQPPLYYLGLTAWQKLSRIPERTPPPPIGSPRTLDRGLFEHETRRDSGDRSLVRWLRLPSILLGAVTVLLTANIGRRVSADPWTPPVAAAVVAGVPTFVFLSGVVNNDNLANALGGLLTLLAVTLVVRGRAENSRVRLGWTAALGGTLGLLVLTKLSTLPLVIGVVVAILVTTSSLRERVKLLGVAAGSSLAVCGWWLIQNQLRYGDPFAARASHDYLEPIGGLGGRIVNGRIVLGIGGRNPFELAFVEVPRTVYQSFWYNSGWNQFKWSAPTYIVFWAALVIAIAGLAIARRRPLPSPRPLLVLVAFAVAGLSTIWITSFQTTTFQARLGFIGLPAIGCLAALGLERWKVPVPLRFIGPAIGVVGTVLAIRSDIVNVNWL